MADVFISYSRRDKAFVQRLHDALKQHDRDPWVDWEGIPPSAEWLKEVFSAIEAAESVIFVLSPDSAASRVCLKEIAHAVEHNKRIIPVVCRDTRSAEAPPAVSALNWIRSREEDDFDAALQLLLQALDTDLVWVKEHTRFLLRAIEWQGHNDDSSYELRGSDLHAAEQWLGRAAAGQEPQPTALQAQYIMASRRSTNRRQRITLMAAAFGVLVAVVLGLISWQHAQAAALYQARDYEADAIGEMAGRSALRAEVLFARSLALDDRQDVRERFLEARSAASRLLWVSPHSAGRRVLAISPDGAQFVVADGRRALRLWNVDRRREILTLQAQPSITCAVFAPTAPLLITGGSDAIIRLWDTASGRLVRTLHGHTGAVQYLAVRPDGRVLASSGRDLTIRLWDIATGRPLRAPLRYPEPIMSLALGPDGRTLATGDWIDSACLWDIASGRITHRLTGHEDTVSALAFSPDGSLLASGSWDCRVWLWDARTGLKLRQLAGQAGRVLSVAFAHSASLRQPDRRSGMNYNPALLACGTDSGIIQLWDAASGRIGLTVRSHLGGHYGGVECVALDTQDCHLIASGDKGIVDVWDLQRIGNPPELRTLHGHTRNVSSVTFTPDGRELVSGSTDGTMGLWNAKTGQLFAMVRAHRQSVNMVICSRDGRYVASASRDHTVRVWDRDATRLRRVLVHPATVWQVAWSPNGKLLASACNDGRLWLWDISTGKAVAVLTGHKSPVLCVSFSADGRRIATGSEDGAIRMWDAAARCPLFVLRGHVEPVWDLDFSPDGRFLASASRDSTLRFWDVQNGEPLLVLRGHDGPVAAVAWSPDSRTVASAGQDGVVRLWQPWQGNHGDQPVLALRAFQGPIWSVEFSRDGRSLAAGSQDCTARVWDLEQVRGLMQEAPGELLQQAEVETGLMVRDHEVVPRAPL